MKKLSYSEVRQLFLDFMKDRGHAIVPSAPIVPEDDPTMLFVAAGMVPLVPYLMGEPHPEGSRIADSQRCLRTVDIDEVGNTTHCTAFEMLGNWSLNDYFKKEAIEMTVEFYTKNLGISIDHIYASVFGGDEKAPRDEVSISVWKEVFKAHGIDAKVGPGQRIQLYTDKCWWELDAGGPCGPCSEFFYDTGKEPCGPDCHINCDCRKFIELGNNVFMEYLKKDSTYSPLGRHNVDFGGGLERCVMLSQQKNSYFETDIYKPIFDRVGSLATTANLTSQRIVTDHIKAATWIVLDGVVPGRTERGYVLRRLIRRAVRHARQLGIEKPFTRQVGEVAITQFGTIYPQLIERKDHILQIIEEEELKFQKTLAGGLKKFESLLTQKGKLTGEDAFYLYETYGFPVEITQELLAERGVTLDIQEFESTFASHQELSRTAAKGFFKGGLADTSDMSKRYHTATHLLHEALRRVLGDGIRQKGSNINPERLRFDFSFDRRMTEDEIAEVETIVNEQIQNALPVTVTEMLTDKALELVPEAMFAEKYGDKVNVYSIGDPDKPFSREICRGPHVGNTSELGTFKITKQENVGSGVKRIKAVLS